MSVVALAVSACTAEAFEPVDVETHRTSPVVTVAPAPEVPRFASTGFIVPFLVDPPAWISADPEVEESTFVAWVDGRAAIRVLAPVEIFDQTSPYPHPPRSDVISYLLGQQRYGAVFSEVSFTMISGYRAMLATATTPESLSGNLGCPVRGLAPEDCHGMQPRLALRLLAVEVPGHPVIAWMRTSVSTPPRTSGIDKRRFAEFVASLEFRH